MTSKTDILHGAFRANGFEPNERLTPLAYIAAADSLASRCVELEKALEQSQRDCDHRMRAWKEALRDRDHANGALTYLQGEVVRIREENANLREDYVRLQAENTDLKRQAARR